MCFDAATRYRRAQGLRRGEEEGDEAGGEGDDPEEGRGRPEAGRHRVEGRHGGGREPFPGGDANGLWKGRPETPFTKCGTAFARKAPPKK